jgi:hypothetical protein
MSIVTQLKLLVKLKPGAEEIEKGIEMKNVTQTIAGMMALATAVYQIPGVKDWVNRMWTTHATVSSIVGGIVAILLLIHQPNTSTSNTQ